MPSSVGCNFESELSMLVPVGLIFSNVKAIDRMFGVCF